MDKTMRDEIIEGIRLDLHRLMTGEGHNHTCVCSICEAWRALHMIGPWWDKPTNLREQLKITELAHREDEDITRWQLTKDANISGIKENPK